MKATSLLVSQHRVVKSIFKKLEDGETAKKPLLVELANNLAAHMSIEQELFYPAIKEVDQTLVFESLEEHSLIELALKRLLATNSQDLSFKARVTATRELVEHHVKEEENDLFPAVDKALGDERLVALGDKMKARFEEVLAGGFDAVVPAGFEHTSSDASLRKIKAA